MINKIIFQTMNTASKASLVLGAVLLATSTKFAGNAVGQSAAITVAPSVVAPGAAILDNYVYYPKYGIYYNSHRQNYSYFKGDTWVILPTPQGVSLDALHVAPSVHMDFHDSPAKHHVEMVKKYPKDWHLSVVDQGQRLPASGDNRK